MGEHFTLRRGKEEKEREMSASFSIGRKEKNKRSLREIDWKLNRAGGKRGGEIDSRN